MKETNTTKRDEAIDEISHNISAASEFPFIDWRRVIVNAEKFFKHFYWPQKVGLVFVSGFQFSSNKKTDVKLLNKVLSIVCCKGKIAFKLKEGIRGTCAYVQYEEHYEGQLAVLLLNGLVFKGNELKVLPCVNLFTEKLPDAIFKPVVYLGQFKTFSVKELQRILQTFLTLWNMFNLFVKKSPILGTTPIIEDAVTCREAIKQIKYHRSRKIAVDCEGIKLGSPEGRLCLLQIATPQMVYLFDVLHGGMELFEEGGLRDLLQDPSLMKIIHDCRNDSVALLQEFDVQLERVFDTQIAYAALSTQTGGPVPIPISLATLLTKYADGDGIKLKEEIKEEMVVDEFFWAQRPLTDKMFKYSQQDVFHLFTIYRNMKQFLNPCMRMTIAARSNQYASLHRYQPVFHVCTPRAQTLPLYNLCDWDRVLINQLFGKVCLCAPQCC